ncbi:MAG: hypothetical protein JO321_10545 [Solirubrobacterales bacterium]|nr:hypothetical protein [Solirubrobacterales bacterium]
MERREWLNLRFDAIDRGRRRGTHQPGRPEAVINDDYIEFPHHIRAYSRRKLNHR